MYDNFSVIYAIYNNHLSVIEWFYKSKYEVEFSNSTVKYWATIGEDNTILKWLEEHNLI